MLAFLTVIVGRNLAFPPFTPQYFPFFFFLLVSPFSFPVYKITPGFQPLPTSLTVKLLLIYSAQVSPSKELWPILPSFYTHDSALNFITPYCFIFFASLPSTGNIVLEDSIIISYSVYLYRVELRIWQFFRGALMLILSILKAKMAF